MKVLDFGLAKSLAVGANGDPVAPAETSLSGGWPDPRDAGLHEPEQARGQPVGKRTDIGAFGCVLFEMLSGKRPFDGATIPDTLAGILEHEPDWTVLPAAVPAAVRTLLRRCLEKEPLPGDVAGVRCLARRRHVAFAATSQGTSILWLRSLDTSTSRTIPGTEGERGPFWKPDSRALGFFAHGQLWTVDLSGGSPIRVGPAELPPPHH